jgi:hypothetical protein
MKNNIMMEFTNEDQSYKKELLSKIDEDKLIEVFEAKAEEDILIEDVITDIEFSRGIIVNSIISINSELTFVVGDSKLIHITENVDVLSTVHLITKSFEIEIDEKVNYEIIKTKMEIDESYEMAFLTSVIDQEISNYTLSGYCIHEAPC